MTDKKEIYKQLHSGSLQIAQVHDTNTTTQMGLETQQSQLSYRLSVNMKNQQEKNSIYNYPYTNAAHLIAGNPFDCLNMEMQPRTLSSSFGGGGVVND
jgi:hypothetical protein